jgi:hypothetical protein
MRKLDRMTQRHLEYPNTDQDVLGRGSRDGGAD